MKLFTHSAATPIGLDIGTRAIKAMQRRGGRVLTLSLPREGDGPESAPLTIDEAKRLRSVLRRRGFQGRDVIVAAPKQSTVTSVLELPPRKSGVPTDLIARTELALAHRREPDHLETVWWELPPSGRASDGTSVLAAGCPHDAADAMIAPLEEAGLSVQAMDLQAWAMARGCGTSNSVPGSIIAVIDLGWTTATLVLLHERTVVYERQLTTLGACGLVGALRRDHGFASDAIDYMLYEVGFDADGRGQPDDWRLLMKARTHLEGHFDALGKELGLSVRYAQHQYPHATVERILLAGGGAAVVGLSDFLKPLLEVPVEVALPFAAAGGAADTEGVASPAMVIASGLCLWDEQEAPRCAA